MFALVDRYRARRVLLNVETKVEAGAPAETAPREQFVQVVARLVRQARMERQVRVQSFDRGALMRMRQVAPRLPIVALTNGQQFLQAGQPGASPWLGGIDIDDVTAGRSLQQAFVAAVASFDADAVSPVHGDPQGGSVVDPGYAPFTTPDLVAAAHDADLEVITWTVNDRPTMQRLTDIGVDGLITDRPDLLRDVPADNGIRLPRPVRARVDSIVAVTDYTAFPTDWSRALAVVAHPDDLEYGGASAVARWTAEGRSVAYVLVTSGEAGIDALPPDECGPLREDEQRAAAAEVGVEVVEFLGHPDGLLEYGIPLRHDIAAAIRRHRPELVVTGNFRDTWPGGTAPNMADHLVTGRATLDAIRDAANRWLFTDSGEPWSGVRRLAAAASPRNSHAVDVTGYLDRGVASLAAHRAYLDGLGGDMADPGPFLRRMAEADGARLPGAELATGFELLDL